MKPREEEKSYGHANQFAKQEDRKSNKKETPKYRKHVLYQLDQPSPR
jgi:hypothetical protein